MTHGWTNARQRDDRVDDPHIEDDGAIEIALNPWMIDLPVLQRIEAGAPVDLSHQQAGVIDRIVNGLGTDALGRRAQGAYRRARDGGQVKVR